MSQPPPRASSGRPLIGVIGGLGPAATLDLYAKVLALTPAARDQDHVRLLQAVRSSEQNQILLPGDSPHRGTWGKSFHLDVFVIGAASTLGVVSAIMVTRNADLTDFAIFSRILAAVSLILAWLLLQIGFSRLYADTWHKGEGEPGLDFPKMEEPGLVEFTYHAFAVGAGFKTSDVEVTTSHMRALVTIHSVTSFLYNAVLVAYVVSIMASA